MFTSEAHDTQLKSHLSILDSIQRDFQMFSIWTDLYCVDVWKWSAAQWTSHMTGSKVTWPPTSLWCNKSQWNATVVLVKTLCLSVTLPPQHCDTPKTAKLCATSTLPTPQPHSHKTTSGRLQTTDLWCPSDSRCWLVFCVRMLVCACVYAVEGGFGDTVVVQMSHQPEEPCEWRLL